MPIGSLSSVNLDDASWSEDLEGQVHKIAESWRVLLVSWSLVQQARISDPLYVSLVFALGQDDKSLWTSNTLREYKKYWQDMFLVDSVALYKGRVVVPRVLPPEVLGALHRAHQGTTGMAFQAQDAVWCLHFGNDLQAI